MGDETYDKVKEEAAKLKSEAMRMGLLANCHDPIANQLATLRDQFLEIERIRADRSRLAAAWLLNPAPGSGLHRHTTKIAERVMKEENDE